MSHKSRACDPTRTSARRRQRPSLKCRQVKRCPLSSLGTSVLYGTNPVRDRCLQSWRYLRFRRMTNLFWAGITSVSPAMYGTPSCLSSSDARSLNGLRRKRNDGGSRPRAKRGDISVELSAQHVYSQIHARTGFLKPRFLSPNTPSSIFSSSEKLPPLPPSPSSPPEGPPGAPGARLLLNRCAWTA